MIRILHKITVLLCYLYFIKSLFIIQAQKPALSDTNILNMPYEMLDSLMKYYNNYGIKYLSSGDYENAEDYLIKSLEIKKIILSETDRRLGNVYVNLGVLYQNTWRFDQALEHFRRAEEIYRRIDSNYIDLGSLYVNEAIVFRILGDFGKAKTFSNNSIRIFNKQENIDYDKLQMAYFNRGVISGNSGELEDAIDYYKKSILIRRNNDLDRILAAYNNIALCYTDLGNIELAQKYYILTLNLSEKISGKDNPENAQYLMNYGIFCIEKLEQNEEGFDLYKKALEMSLKKSGLKNTLTAQCYHNIGEYYLKIKDYHSALNNFQNSLIAAETNFNDTLIYSNPVSNQKKVNFRILETLKKKAETFLLLYYETGSIKFLDECFKTYEIVLEIIDKIRFNFQTEESRFIITSKQNETYLKAIHVAGSLYEKTKNSIYLNKAFTISEKARAFSLLVSIRDFAAKEFGGIPEELLNQEKDLFRRLSLYDELIYEEKKKAKPDQVKIDLWEEKLFWANQDYDKILTKFENDFSEYFRLKYNWNFININNVSDKIEQSQTLLEYSLTDSNVYIFVSNSKNNNLFKVKIDSSFFNNLLTLTQDLSRTNFSLGVHESYINYKKAAYELYKILIQPCQEMIQGKSLIIIPDGALSYLPFEALLTHPVMNDEPDYRNLPYLIRDYDIGYAYSSTLHFQDKRKIPKTSGNLLAFAPDYSNLISQNTIDLSFLDAYRDQLVPIPGVKDEVKMIARMIKSDVYIDDLATENNFKKLAGNYDILHLAMHTIVDNENPMYSKLAFTQNVDSFEDGFLNTYEIYNMKYNARLAVLSSCQTGYGKLQKGEGVMSLARGFMYAGCPSIVMTLWQVSDRSGARLMKDFYRSLKNGKNKTASLRDAKLEFLRKADQLKAHPYFWSTYVVIGDSSPLYPPRFRLLWIIIILFLITSAGTGAYWYFIIRPKRSKNTGKLQQDRMYS
jgi:CHAT domain-containing protein/Tfp pilus assembly protein PilF